MPYIISDASGDNYVDSVNKKTDPQGKIYYEFRGRNNTNQERIVHLYDKGVAKYFYVDGGVEKPASEKGRVHGQIESAQAEILEHFNMILDFAVKKEVPKRPPVMPKAKELSDSDVPSKDFFVQAAKRAMDLGDKVASKQHGAHHTRQAMIGFGSKFYDEGDTTRLNLFKELVDGSKDGYYYYAATTAYGLSLLTYIATNYDKLDKTERKRLYQLYQTVAGDIPALDLKPNSNEYRQALGKGLKAEVNDFTSMREKQLFGSDISGDVRQYTHDLVHGNSLGRPIIDKQTSLNVSATDGNAVNRKIPAFFPIPPDSNSTDQIVLQGGGCRTHSAITCIWKQGVDADGNPVVPGDGKTIERFRVYRTVCNAGFGTTFDVRTNPPALYHEFCSADLSGKTYSVCTQEVLLGKDVPYTHEAMQKQVEALIDAERQLLLFHDLPGKKGPNGEVGTLDKIKQEQWRKLNQSIPLGPVEVELSELTLPQSSGNCTVRSIEEYERWELRRAGATSQEAAAILNRHWDFASKHDSAATNKLLSSPPPQQPKPKPSATTGYVISDPNGDNYVDSVSRKIDQAGYVFYEFRGRNSANQERIVHLYANGVRKYLIAENGTEKIAAKKGTVHGQIETHQAEIIKKFNVTLDFTPPPKPKPEANSMNIVQKIRNFFTQPEIPEFPSFSPDTATQVQTDKLVEDIRTGKVKCPKPKMMKMSDLLADITPEPSDIAQNGIGYHLLERCDANALASFDCMQGSVRQVASQFNNGEAPSRKLTTPNLFRYDRTQGPAEQRTSGGAAISRFAHNADCDCFGELLKDPLLKQEFESLFNYQFGYLTPKGGKEKAGVDFLRKHVDKLVLNVERVGIDGKPGQTAIQVLNAGIAVGGYDDQPRQPQDMKYLSEMTDILLGAQYKAVASVAILEAQQNPTKRIPVTFTMVGGGVFGNDKTMIAKAISQAMTRIKESGVNNVDICVSIYNPAEIQEYKQLTANGEQFAEFRKLLSQTPITQDKLKSIKALPLAATPEPELDTDPKPVKPSVPDNKDQLISKFSNAAMLEAMKRAMDSMSQKSHLDTKEGANKKSRLEGCIKDYQKADSPEAAKAALLKFVIEASKQRQSWWGSMFTARFGETASAQALFSNMNTKELKQILCDAANLNVKNPDQVKFKDFAQHIRSTQEANAEKDTDHKFGAK